MTAIGNEIASATQDAWRWIGEASRLGPQDMLPVADGMLRGLLDYHVLLDDGGDETFAEYQQYGTAIGKLARAASNPAACVRLAKATHDVLICALTTDGKPIRAYGDARIAMNDALSACIGKPE